MTLGSARACYRINGGADIERQAGGRPRAGHRGHAELTPRPSGDPDPCSRSCPRPCPDNLTGSLAGAFWAVGRDRHGSLGHAGARDQRRCPARINRRKSSRFMPSGARIENCERHQASRTTTCRPGPGSWSRLEPAPLVLSKGHDRNGYFRRLRPALACRPMRAQSAIPAARVPAAMSTRSAGPRTIYAAPLPGAERLGREAAVASTDPGRVSSSAKGRIPVEQGAARLVFGGRWHDDAPMPSATFPRPEPRDRAGRGRVAGGGRRRGAGPRWPRPVSRRRAVRWLNPADPGPAGAERLQGR